MSSINDLFPLMEESFNNNLKFELPVNGTSMLPLLHTGDYVLLESIKTAKIKKRDVIFYKRENGQYVLHRIYRKRDTSLIMLGDNQLNKETLNANLVIAKMVGYTHENKFVSIKSFKYRLYSFIWNIYPLRFLIMKVKWALSRRIKK
ncbi:MAG: S24/S26 family peptidase [Erysipelotrichales bacterium]|nr:S24/S26 family peptidase [Erysipelotrichales bacterium]